MIEPSGQFTVPNIEGKLAVFLSGVVMCMSLIDKLPPVSVHAVPDDVGVGIHYVFTLCVSVRGEFKSGLITSRVVPFSGGLPFV